MAWFYNLILLRFFEIGLVATSRRHYSPAATAVHSFAFFLGKSANFKISASLKTSKTAFLNVRRVSQFSGCFYGRKKTICLFVPIWESAIRATLGPFAPSRLFVNVELIF